MRLIDADLTANSINARMYKSIENDGKDSFSLGLLLAEQIVMKAPTVEMRTKSKWFRIKGTDVYECTNCGWRTGLNNYCPYCGADMREESNNTEEL